MNKLYTAIAGIILASGLQQPVHGKEAEQNPYLAIVKRNAFELTDTPPSTQQKTPEALKASDIKLTGIFLRNGVERAAIALIEKDTKNTKPTYLQLAVGEKQGTVEIKAIDKVTGRVSLLQLGSERELNFKDDVFKTAMTKAPRTSSKSSSSRSGSSSDAARRTAEYKAAIERKKAEKTAGKSKGDEQKVEKKAFKQKLSGEMKKAVERGQMSKEEYNQAWQEIKGELKGSK
jgi:type IV secretory pathway VirB10-like protein